MDSDVFSMSSKQGVVTIFGQGQGPLFDANEAKDRLLAAEEWSLMHDSKSNARYLGTYWIAGWKAFSSDVGHCIQPNQQNRSGDTS